MRFTEDWFTNNIPTWNKVLGNLRNKPVKFLEIGSFEGRSATWALENILTHKDSQLYCIDHWLYEGDKNKNVYNKLKYFRNGYKIKIGKNFIILIMISGYFQ